MEGVLSGPASEKDVENALAGDGAGDAADMADAAAEEEKDKEKSSPPLPEFPFTARANGGSKKTHKLRAKSALDSKEVRWVGCVRVLATVAPNLRSRTYLTFAQLIAVTPELRTPTCLV